MKRLKILNKFKNKNQTKTTKKSLKDKLAIVVSVFLVLAILVSSSGIAYIAVVISGAPTLDSNDFVMSDSSKLFDSDGNLITDVGYQIRENISYDDMTYSYTNHNRKIRVYNQVNARLILGDLFAKLKINYGT